jgi:dihydrofolate synthase / folylpolyglutamate synthase
MKSTRRIRLEGRDQRSLAAADVSLTPSCLQICSRFDVLFDFGIWNLAFGIWYFYRMFTTYQQTLDYLYENLPMFQRIGAAAYKADLSNTIRLCDALGNPQDKFKSIHVAGTNGKGSSSHMLASIFQEAKYKTGLYTSPHLKSFTERIRINGVEVSETFIIEFVNRIQPLIDELKPSFFEITVAMAFEYFAQEKVDIAVIEVGLGGRLDSTNVITPEVSLITNIGWDHQDLLGNTLEKIAVEKAGIIKQGVPVVVSERQDGIDDVFLAKAKEQNAAIYFASDQFDASLIDDKHQLFKDGNIAIRDVKFPLKGAYQSNNVRGVLNVVEVLRKKKFKITDAAVKRGLQNVVRNTHLKGRWQILKKRPLMICDTGHNIDGIEYVVHQLKAIPHKQLHIVFGVNKDKSIDEILKVLPLKARYYFCQAKLPRALDASALAKKAEEFGLQGHVIPDVNEAKKSALKNASDDDLIFIGGSTFVVAEINEL